MECELRSLRQASQSQERTIQGLTESLSTKDSEVCVCLYLNKDHCDVICKPVVNLLILL